MYCALSNMRAIMILIRWSGKLRDGTPLEDRFTNGWRQRQCGRKSDEFPNQVLSVFLPVSCQIHNGSFQRSTDCGDNKFLGAASPATGFPKVHEALILARDERLRFPVH